MVVWDGIRECKLRLISKHPFLESNQIGIDQYCRRKWKTVTRRFQRFSRTFLWRGEYFYDVAKALGGA